MNPIISSLLVGTALLFMPYQSHALSITVGSATVNVGDTFTVNVNVAGAVNLISWQLDLGYNPSQLQANSVTEGSFLSSAGSTTFIPGFIDNTAGLIGGMSGLFADLIPPSGSGVLAAIEFTALAAGPSTLTTSGVFLNFSDSGFTVTNGSTCAGGGAVCGGTPVPEPSSVMLLFLGGLALWGWRRRHDQVALKH